MNPVLKLALEISNGNQIMLNRSEKLTQSLIDYTKGNSRMFDSVYFSKNGVEYRISNHELPNRFYMQSNVYTNEPLKFHKNNIEIIVGKDGDIIKNNLNFNIN